jgi:hypothetical protein
MIPAGSTELENLDLQSRALAMIHPNPSVIQAIRTKTSGGSRSMELEVVSCDSNARVPGVTTFR